MKINLLFLSAATATAASVGRPRDANTLIQEYRAALLPNSTRSAVFSVNTCTNGSDDEVTASVTDAASRVLAMERVANATSAGFLLNSYYPRVHLMMTLNRQAAARDRCDSEDHKQAAHHANLMKKISAMIAMPDSELDHVARSVGSLRFMAIKAIEYGIQGQRDIQLLLRSIEDLIEVLVINGRHCLAIIDDESIPSLLQSMEELMRVPPVRTRAAGWEKAIPSFKILVETLREFAESAESLESPGDRHFMFHYIELVDTITAIRFSQYKARGTA